MSGLELDSLYQDYPEMPYISCQRDIGQWLVDVKQGKEKLVPKRHMVRTSEGLLPGQIIYLWLIQFGTHTTANWTPKYFEYTYGIDGPTARQALVDEGYVEIQTAFDSLAHIPAGQIKEWLKEKGIKGLSKMKKEELIKEVQTNISELELNSLFEVRGYVLTEKGQAALANNQAIVERHPKKKF